MHHPGAPDGKGSKIEKKKRFNLAGKIQSRMTISILTFRIAHKYRSGGRLTWIFPNLAWNFQSWRAILNVFNLGALRESGVSADSRESTPKYAKASVQKSAPKVRFVRFMSLFLGKAAQCRQKVCSSKRPPKLDPRSVRPNEVFENLACRISPE